MESSASTMSVADRMQLALRKNRGRLAAPGYRESAAEALGLSPDGLRLTDLEERDRVFARFAPERQRTVRECGEPGRFCFEGSEPEQLAQAAAELRPRFPRVEMYLFREQNDICGAILVESDRLFERLFSLIERDGEDLLACTADGSAGLFCAWWGEPRPSSPESVYALQAWYPAAEGR